MDEALKISLEVVAGVVGGTIVVGAISEYIIAKCGKRKAKVLDKQYGPQIIDNLKALEEAVRKNDLATARKHIYARRGMLDAIDGQSGNYAKGEAFACEEVRKALRAGEGLEAYVKAVYPNDMEA